MATSKKASAANRDALTPGQNATRGTVAGGIASAAAAMIIANNPENQTALMLAPIASTVIMGFLSGLGNAARTATHAGKAWGGFFGWLG
jgi:hypothetical protein